MPLETRTPNSFVRVFDDTNGLTTGVAGSNFGLQTTITATFRDDAGARVGVPQSIRLPARPQIFCAAGPASGEINELFTLVGAARFELTTPCAQGRCATRLRYAPTHSIVAAPVCHAILILKFW